MTHTKLSLLLLTTALAPVGTAWAQDETAQDDVTGYLGEISVAAPESPPAAPAPAPVSSYQAPVDPVPIFAEAPALVPTRIDAAPAQANLGNTLISDTDLEFRNPETVAGVFSGETSVSVSGGAAIAQKVFVNGIEESLLSVTIDGARQNKSAFHHTGNVLLDPSLLKRVEVSEGLAPADAGAGALAGMIAYETKDARDLLEPGQNFGGLLTLGVSSNGEGFRSSLALYGEQDGFEWLLSGTRSAADPYEDGDGNEVTGTETDLDDVMAKAAYTTESGHRFEFSYSDTEDSGERAGQAGPDGAIYIRPDFAGVVGRDTVLVDALSHRTSYNFTYTNEQPTGLFAPTVQLSYNEQEMDAGAVEGLNTSLSGSVKNQFELANGTVTAGFDFFDETAESTATTTKGDNEELFDVGAFIQARQDLTDIVSVSYGARYDWQSFEGADGSEFEEGGFSLNGSVDVKITETLSFNAGAASTFGGYELGEAALINFGTPWDYTGFTTSRSNAARVGLRYDDGAWQASGALFYTEINDIAAVLPTSGARGALSDMTSKGFDGSLAYYWEQGFARANYTYADVEVNGEVASTTAYYLGRPVGHMFALEAGWDVNDSLSVGGSAEIALENNDTAVTLPGYAVVNLNARYTPKAMPNAEIRFDVNNVFNETYASRSSDGLDAANVIALNEPGRSFALTAKIKF